MHPSVQQWVSEKVDQLGLAEKSVLECGSHDYNGTVRQWFRGAYVGIDMVDGPGVDIVASAADLPFPDGTFEVVVTTEMLEHDPSFWLSLPEMARVLGAGGWLLLTTRGIGFPYHEFPGDYWRFTQDSIDLLFNLAGLKTVELTDDPYPNHPGVFGLAWKERP